MRALCFFLLFSLISCQPQEEPIKNTAIIPEISQPKEYTAYSTLENQYLNFNSPKAINKIAALENEHFKAIENGGISRYYGTEWEKVAWNFPTEKGICQFEDYQNNLKTMGLESDSLHCTIYAYEGLKAGLEEADLEKLERYHHQIWKNREKAGWSVGYILVKYFGWTAYLVIDKNSQEFDHCMQSYRSHKTYPVWKQPHIPLEEVYIKGEDDEKMEALLSQNEFGWGFSYQGYHTWITRFNQLKECNWLSSPSTKYWLSAYEKPLFITTPFKEYIDYDSHIVFFPPMIDTVSDGI